MMLDTLELREIGVLLKKRLCVEFANNGHSSQDGLLQMRIPQQINEVTLQEVAGVLNEFFRNRGLSVEYNPAREPMLYLRARDQSLTSGVSVTITNRMLLIVFPKDKEE